MAPQRGAAPPQTASRRPAGLASSHRLECAAGKTLWLYPESSYQAAVSVVEGCADATARDGDVTKLGLFGDPGGATVRVVPSYGKGGSRGLIEAVMAIPLSQGLGDWFGLSLSLPRFCWCLIIPSSWIPPIVGARNVRMGHERQESTAEDRRCRSWSHCVRQLASPGC